MRKRKKEGKEKVDFFLDVFDGKDLSLLGGREEEIFFITILGMRRCYSLLNHEMGV